MILQRTSGSQKSEQYFDLPVKYRGQKFLNFPVHSEVLRIFFIID